MKAKIKNEKLKIKNVVEQQPVMRRGRKSKNPNELCELDLHATAPRKTRKAAINTAFCLGV